MAALGSVALRRYLSPSLEAAHRDGSCANSQPSHVDTVRNPVRFTSRLFTMSRMRREGLSRRTPVARAQVQEGAPPSAEEEAAWKRRQEESKQAEEEEGRSAGDSDHWRWTLNWDGITPEIVVGSCPRSAPDIDTLAKEAGITAIVNLQSDICFEALQIPFDELKQRAVETGVLLARVPVRDFDHGDQAAMLPEAVRVVNLLVTRGHKVYVHCTAGINRAPLVALAYLYFIQGLRRDEALKLVKTARGIANPYLDCLTEAKRRLLEGRDEELTALATDIYEQRCRGECKGDASSDWSGAQARALARSFAKYLEVDLGLLDAERDVLQRVWRLESARPVSLPPKMSAKLDTARALVQEQRGRISQLKALVKKWEKDEEEARAKADELEAGLLKKAVGEALADKPKEEKGKAVASPTAAAVKTNVARPGSAIATNGKPPAGSNGVAPGNGLSTAGNGSATSGNGKAPVTPGSPRSAPAASKAPLQAAVSSVEKSTQKTAVASGSSPLPSAGKAGSATAAGGAAATGDGVRDKAAQVETPVPKEKEA